MTESPRVKITPSYRRPFCLNRVSLFSSFLNLPEINLHTMMSNAKRFMAYELIKRLGEKDQQGVFEPVKGKWNLCNDYLDYPHSSAAFYENGINHELISIKDFRDI